MKKVFAVALAALFAGGLAISSPADAGKGGGMRGGGGHKMGGGFRGGMKFHGNRGMKFGGFKGHRNFKFGGHRGMKFGGFGGRKFNWGNHGRGHNFGKHAFGRKHWGGGNKHHFGGKHWGHGGRGQGHGKSWQHFRDRFGGHGKGGHGGHGIGGGHGAFAGANASAFAGGATINNNNNVGGGSGGGSSFDWSTMLQLGLSLAQSGGSDNSGSYCSTCSGSESVYHTREVVREGGDAPSAAEVAAQFCRDSGGVYSSRANPRCRVPGEPSDKGPMGK